MTPFSSVHQNTRLGQDCRIGDYTIIGMPPRGFEDGELPTVLGDRVDVQSHAVISAGNVFGDDCIVGHGTFMRHNNRFGHRVTIGPHNTIEWDNVVEDDVTIGAHSGVAEQTFVGRGSWIGPQVSMASVLHPLCPKAKDCTKGPHLSQAVTVGAGSVIFPDIYIGEGAYVEPNTVVMRDVRPYTVVSGRYGQAKGDVLDLCPGLMSRLEPYVNLSEASVRKVRAEFDARPSLFPAQVARDRA